MICRDPLIPFRLGVGCARPVLSITGEVLYVWGYLLLLCVAVSSYVRKGVSTAAAVCFDTCFMMYFDWEFERTAPALPFMEMAEGLVAGNQSINTR